MYDSVSIKLKPKLRLIGKMGLL